MVLGPRVGGREGHGCLRLVYYKLEAGSGGPPEVQHGTQRLGPDPLNNSTAAFDVKVSAGKTT